MRETDSKLVELSPTVTDTGLKKIKVTILWTERGEEKMLSLGNLREDPNRQATDSTISGTVYELPGGSALINANVYIAENINWQTNSGTDGTYSLRVSSGNWHVCATKQGYWSAGAGPINIAKGETKTQDLTLSEKAKGSAYGFAYLNQHLVISEICAKWSASDEREYVELYNPTTWSWTINSSTLKLKRIKFDGETEEIVSSYINNTILPEKYFLFLGSIDGSTITASGVLANATYYAKIETSDRGIALQDGNGVSIDTASWAVGLSAGSAVERFSYPSGIISGYGNAYDTDSSADFYLHIGLNPENTFTSEAPISGTPATGAVVTCNDGLSSHETVSTTGHWFLTNIATGTWTITISTSSFYREVTNVSILTNLSTSVPNGSTHPPWLVTNWSALILSSSTTEGFISGKVTSGTNPLENIRVDAGISFKMTNSEGRYSLQLTPGDYQITVNPTSPAEYYNPNYTSSTTATTTVNTGQIATIPDITLLPAGMVKGKVTSNGIDPLPNIIISAYDKNSQLSATEISNEQGEYTFSQLSTSGNNYTIKPELDAGESSSPESVSLEIKQGETVRVSTFTISSAYGKITGTVKESNELIKTGVLVMATTATISSEPPVINYNLRIGLPYYYSTVSLSNGTYSLSVRGSVATYNVYAWYTKLTGTTVSTTRKDRTARVPAGQTVSNIDFSWP